ncbi:unnamed protein product, partial [marine sediment metagenome]
YIADGVFPIIDGVNKQAKVMKNKKGAWFRDEAEVRAPGSPAVIIESGVGTENLDPVNYAAAGKVTDELRAGANEPGALPIQPDMNALNLIANALDLKREIRVSALVHATDWSGAGAGGVDAEGHWGDSTAASDTFLSDLVTGRDTILSNTGLLPNTLALSYPAWSKLQYAPALLALMYPTSLGPNSIVTLAGLAALALVDTIFVGTAIKNTAEETLVDGLTSEYVWGTDGGTHTKGFGFLYYRPLSLGLDVASAGLQYRLKNSISGQARLSTSWRIEGEHSDYYD